MEFLFRENNSQHRIKYSTTDMEYLCKHYPHIVDGFMTKLNAVNESGQILEILEITKPATPYDRKQIHTLIQDNIRLMNECVKSYKKSQIPQDDFTA